MTAATTRPILPVGQTVGEAFASVPANLAPMLRIFWAWIAVVMASMASVVGFWTLLWPTRPPEDASLAAFIVPALFLMAVVLVSFSSAAVAWHRLLLLGEQPPSLYLRVGGQVPRYVGRLLLVMLLASAVQLLCGLITLRAGLLPVSSPDAPPSNQDLLTQSLIGIAISIPAILIMTRLSISLPAIAIERALTLHEAMHLTKGNGWQLCGGTLLVYAPSYLLGFLLGLSTAVGDALATLLLIAASFFSTVATISFLSLAYRFFVGAPQPLEP